MRLVFDTTTNRILARNQNTLFRALRLHRKAIGYTVDNLKRIHLSMSMLRILMEDGYNLLIELQRRLNPIMKKLVKKKFEIR